MRPDENTPAEAAPTLNWQDGSTLRWIEQPEEIDSAFVRREPLVGVSVIALALNHPDANAILPRVARALVAEEAEVRRQGVVALAHVARLHRTVDRRCLNLLRGFPRGNEADDDLWSFVDHRRLPLWLWRHHAAQGLAWQVHDRWRD